MTNDIEPSLDFFINAALGKKALHLVALDVEELSSVADIFIICSGRSTRQVKAISEHIELKLKNEGVKPLSVEGVDQGHWVLMDYGHVIIHIFYEPVRSFYDLESLWVDAKRIQTDSLKNLEESDGPGPSNNDFDFNGDYDGDYSETI